MASKQSKRSHDVGPDMTRLGDSYKEWQTAKKMSAKATAISQARHPSKQKKAKQAALNAEAKRAHSVDPDVSRLGGSYTRSTERRFTANGHPAK